MAWMTKDLALDLLAILIGATQNAYNRIKDAPDAGWPPAVEQPTNEPAKQQPTAAAVQQQEEAPKQDTPPAPQPKQESAPAPDGDALLVEAKTLLQGIVASGDREWVTGTLLPQFGMSKLSDVPADKLPQLIEVAKQKQQEMNQ